MHTKACPVCRRPVALASDKCGECGYDFMAEPCPGCQRPISVRAIKCPYCQYNLFAGTPAEQEPKVRKPSKPPKPHEHGPSPAPSVFCPHIYAAATRGLDFSELRWSADEVTDENFLYWAKNLRRAWETKAKSPGWLTNHAVVLLARAVIPASPEDPCNLGLNDRLFDLLGGRD